MMSNYPAGTKLGAATLTLSKPVDEIVADGKPSPYPPDHPGHPDNIASTRIMVKAMDAVSPEEAKRMLKGRLAHLVPDGELEGEAAQRAAEQKKNGAKVEQVTPNIPTEPRLDDYLGGRTEDEMVNATGIKIVLGGRVFTVEPLKRKAAKPWKQQVEDIRLKRRGLHVKGEGLKEKITSMTVKEMAAMSPEDREKITEEMGDMVGMVTDQITQSSDDTLNLICAYSPVLEVNKEWIDEEATDIDITTAFEKIMDVAFPFVRNTQALMGQSRAMM